MAETEWAGDVAANLEEGQSTGIKVSKGDKLTIVANGWATRGPDKLYGPQGDKAYQPKGTIYPEAPCGALLAKIGDQIFPIRSGVFRWEAPASGEIVFVFNDTPAGYGNNTGAFKVSVGKEGKANTSDLQTGIISTSSPATETRAGNTSTFIQVAFPKPFPDGARVIVIPMVQTFNGQDSPGLRIAEVTTAGFKIRMNELVVDGKPVGAPGGKHDATETIGWAAFAA